MSYGQFVEHWEQEAKSERARYDSCAVSELLADVRAGRFGSYYQIWHSIGARACLAEAGSLLADVLESDADYLHRYHCAEALISIGRGDSEGFRPEELSVHGMYPVRERVAELRQRLQV